MKSIIQSACINHLVNKRLVHFIIPCFFIRCKITVYYVSPYFAQLLSFVRISQRPVGIIIFCHFGGVISDTSHYPVVERLACQSKTISPSNRCFPPFRTQVCHIHSGRRGTIYARQSLSCHQHIFGITNICIKRYIQTVIKKTQVQTYIFCDYSFPGQIGRVRS